jgi:hypothetical protein
LPSTTAKIAERFFIDLGMLEELCVITTVSKKPVEFIVLGVLFAIILLPPLIVHLRYRWSVKEDERLYRIQKRVDNFHEDDLSR